MFLHMVRHKNIKHSVKIKIKYNKSALFNYLRPHKKIIVLKKKAHTVFTKNKTDYQNFHILLLIDNFLFAYILLLHVNIFVTGSFNIFEHLPCFFLNTGYGNTGCQISNEGIQNLIYLGQKSTFF